MFSFKSKEEALAKKEKLQEDKKAVEKEIKHLQEEIEALEEKVGLGTPRFLEADHSDAKELEEKCDLVEFYEMQLKKINYKIEKIAEKFNKINKR